MAEDSSSEDRTEEPTARRLQKAREDGEAARSMEVPAAAVLIASFAFLIYSGAAVVEKLRALFAAGFVFDRRVIFSEALLPGVFAEFIGEAFLVIIPLLVVTLIAAAAASGLTGGYLFAMKSAMPNFGKLNPLSGFKRMFGTHALVELTKAIVKFSLVSAVLVWAVDDEFAALLQLGSMALEPALAAAGDLVLHAALVVAVAYALIAAADAGYQRYSFHQRMMMTKQEVRDEMKDMEGRPEVKAQIRRKQQELATSRMMDRVKDADVIVTNPEHFAVALAYDPNSEGAPVVIAKGVDSLAFRIIEVARANGIETFQAPPLARALYFTTKLEQAIPEPLYYATAQVIAYVFSLTAYRPGEPGVKRPVVDVPPDMRFNPDGTREAAAGA